MSEVNRRDFLAAATLAACACATCGLGEALAAGEAGGTIDVGPLSSFKKDGLIDQWVRSSRIVIVRNDGRLYACSAICTHKNAVLSVKGTELVCAKHGSRFSPYGTVTKGPAKDSLLRYGISVNDRGNVIVDTSKSFREKNWDDAGAYIEIKK